ncbi:hypothetical protein [Tsukamurella pulmonis]|nr:hypothetical protein [Tsukamurella pulmonis]
MYKPRDNGFGLNCTPGAQTKSFGVVCINNYDYFIHKMKYVRSDTKPGDQPKVCTIPKTGGSCTYKSEEVTSAATTVSTDLKFITVGYVPESNKVTKGLENRAEFPASATGMRVWAVPEYDVYDYTVAVTKDRGTRDLIGTINGQYMVPNGAVRWFSEPL